MMKMIWRINRSSLLWAALTILGSAIVGCEYFPESTFKLASESRLPKWITLPLGHTRADISLTMSYYISPSGKNVKFILQDAKEKTPIKLYGKEKDGGPFELKHPPQGFPPGYPAYEVITVNGVTEIIEHRKAEPIFYVTDDDAVWKELGGAYVQQ